MPALPARFAGRLVDAVEARLTRRAGASSQVMRGGRRRSPDGAAVAGAKGAARRARTLRALAGLLVAGAAALAGASPAWAGPLVSNAARPAAAEMGLSAEFAQGFVTGPSPEGYAVNSVAVHFGDIPAGFSAAGLTVTLRPETSGEPDRAGLVLRNPAVVGADSAAVFTVPPGASHLNTTLSPDTRYFVVLSYAGCAPYPKLVPTTSTIEDPTSVAGWSIDDRLLRFGKRGFTLGWSDNAGVAMRIEVEGVAEPVRPDAPEALAAQANLGEAVLGWTEGLDGGGAITGYEYRQSTDGGDNWDDWTDIAGSGAGTTSHTVEGLVSGLEYTFEVWAVNVAGAGPASNRASVTVPVTPTSTLGREVWSATLTVGEPATGELGYGSSEGALDDTAFSYLDTDHTVKVLTADASELTLRLSKTLVHQTRESVFHTLNTNLSLHVGDRELSFEDADRSGTGRDIYTWTDDVPVWSEGEKVALSLRDHRPSAPRGLAAEPGAGEVTLRWAVPASDGGRALTSYWYRQSTDGGDNWDSALLRHFFSGGGTTSHTVGGLTNGTEYTFELIASNGRGYSDSSEQVSATPGGGKPGAPTGLAATAGHGYALLTWTAPASDGGNPLTGYQVRHYRLGGPLSGTFGPWTDIGGDAGSTRLTVTGLDNGTTYTFQVRAVNAAGAGAASNQASATPAAGTEPRMHRHRQRYAWNSFHDSLHPSMTASPKMPARSPSRSAIDIPRITGRRVPTGPA